MLNLPELNKIYQGDVLAVLKTWPDEFVDCIITSPPYYGLRDYQVNGQIGLEKTLQEYLDKMLEVTAELKRVLKPTGTLWWNHGDSYASTPSGSYGKESFIRPSMTENMRARKLHGIRKDVPEKSLLLQAHRLAIRMTDEQNWILRNTIIWHKPNVMPSSVKDRFTVDYEPVFFFTKSKKYWFETQYEKRETEPEKDLERIRNQQKGNNKHKQGGVMAYKNTLTDEQILMQAQLGRNKRSVWKIPTHPYSEAHFATFPPALIATPIKAGCPEMICKKCGVAREKIVKTDYNWQTKSKTKGLKQSSGQMATIPGHATKKVTEIGYTDCGCNAGWNKGIVLDPFMGSGTTALMARSLGRNYLGIELSKEYCKLAEKRLAQKVLF